MNMVHQLEGMSQVAHTAEVGTTDVVEPLVPDLE